MITNGLNPAIKTDVIPSYFTNQYSRRKIIVFYWRHSEMGHYIRNKYRKLSECLIQMRKYNFILLSDIVEWVIIYCILSECLYRWEWVWLSLVDPTRKWEHYFTTMKVQRAVRVLNDNYLFNIFGQRTYIEYGKKYNRVWWNWALHLIASVFSSKNTTSCFTHPSKRYFNSSIKSTHPVPRTIILLACAVPHLGRHEIIGTRTSPLWSSAVIRPHSLNSTIETIIKTSIQLRGVDNWFARKTILTNYKW